MPTFALCDCNSFYCSCEAVFQPRLWGQPVVVLSNNDGCAIARSPEAKALGIPMGAPAFQWREFFREHRVEVFSSNYALYGDMSRRVMETLRQHAAAVEVYSIDEAFLSLEGMATDRLEAHAQTIRQTVRQWTGIPIGVGVASSKLLTKLANRQAKKTGGVCVLDHRSTEGQAIIEGWPCQELWGVAGRLANRLAKLGIFTAGQLSPAPRPTIRRQFGVVGERLVLELQGVSCLELEEVTPDRKNIRCSRSFGHPVTDLEEVRQAVATHAARAKGEAAAARAGGVCGVRVPANRSAPGGSAAVPSASRAGVDRGYELHPGTRGRSDEDRGGHPVEGCAEGYTVNQRYG